MPQVSVNLAVKKEVGDKMRELAKKHDIGLGELASGLIEQALANPKPLSLKRSVRKVVTEETDVIVTL